MLVGVPQGLTLSPLLYLYIADIPQFRTMEIAMYEVCSKTIEP